jgi:hypothetical protein
MNIECSDNNDGFTCKHTESTAKMQKFCKIDAKAFPCELIYEPFGITLLNKLTAVGDL